MNREPIYTTAIAAGRALFGGLRVKPIVSGAKHLPATGGAVIAMTHFGYLDFALVEWAMWRENRRRIRFMAKRSVFEKPIVGWLMRGMRHISVDMQAGAAAYTNAIDALKRGELIGVFPEAGVSASFTVRELKTGAARLAAEAGVPLVPIAVWGGHRLLTKNRRIRLKDRLGAPVSFAVGAPMLVSAADDARIVTDRLRDILQDLVDAAQSTYPDEGTGAWWHPRHRGGTAPTAEEAAAADAERDRRRRDAGS